ncbi:unnamed protein product [Boreogadus saida]
MSHLNPGLISAYNSLTDKHLAGYFSNTRIRRHLQRVGLITRSGRIVPDKEYRNRLMHRVHQKHVRECLAQAIFHKVLDMERVHQIDIKRRLEEFARRERVHKMKVERSKRYEEDLIQILSPRPPTGPRGVRTQHSVPEGEPSESSESPGSSRPHTAPETLQRPARLQPITCSGAAASQRRRPPRRHRVSADHRQQQPLDGTNPDGRNPLKRGITAELCQGVSPYCLPVINNFVTPVPPTTKRRDRGTRVASNGTVRGRRLRSTTTTDANEEPPMLRGSVHQSRVGVNMVYCGKTVHLSRDLVDLRDEVKVFQQHCGGENLCVYKGRLQEGEAFQFVSRRHRGFPFSLTFFLNGLQVERISSCCEFKHRRGSRLTGRRKHFGFTGVEGASPCYKCIIAMGLDKKPTPPPKRVTDGTETETTSSPSDAHKETAEEKEREEVEEDGKERTASTADPRTPQPQDMETDIKEEIIHEDKPRDDYEEDFEADDEADENSKAKQSKAPSHSSDKEQQRKDKYASDSEDDDGDEGSRSRSASRSSSSERPSEDEDPKGDHRHAAESEDPRGDADPPEPRREEPPAEPAAGDPPTEADTPDTEIPVPSLSPPSPPSPPPDPPAAPAAAEEAEDHGGKGRDTGETAPEESETSVPPGSEGKGHEDTPTPASAAEDGEGEEVPAEPERAKSVQEKLAEAILTEGQCHSEPELSDTTTEEDEEFTGRDNQQNNKEATPIDCKTSETQEPTQPEENKCEASLVDAAEVEEETVEHQDDQEELKAKQTNEEAGEEKDEELQAEEETPALEADPVEETIETEKEDSEEKDDMEASPPQEPEETVEEVEENQEATPQADEPAKPGDKAEEEEVVEEIEEVEEVKEEEVKEVEDAVEESKEDVEEVKEVVEEVKEVEDAVEKSKEDVKEEVEEVKKEDGMEADSQPEAKNNEANEDLAALEPEEKKDVETALQQDAEEPSTAATSETVDENPQPSEEPATSQTVDNNTHLSEEEPSTAATSQTADTNTQLSEEEPATSQTADTNTPPSEEPLTAATSETVDTNTQPSTVATSQTADTNTPPSDDPADIGCGETADDVEKQEEGKDNNVEKSEAGQVEEGSDLKAKGHNGNDREEEEECKTEEESMQKVEAMEATEQTKDGIKAEAKETLEVTYDKASEVADEENVQKEEKPEKDIEETGDENSSNKVDVEGSEIQVAEIENSVDTKESSQSTEDQAVKQAEQVEENDPQKQASETAEKLAETTVDQEPVTEAEKTSDESNVETENVGDALKADKAIGIQPEDEAKELKGNMPGSDGDNDEDKDVAENSGAAGQGTSAETKENIEDQGNQAKRVVVGEKIDPKHSEEPNEEKKKEEDRTNDHEEKDNQSLPENVDQGPRVDQVPKVEEEQLQSGSKVVESAKSKEAKEPPDKKDTGIDDESPDENQGKGSEMNTRKDDQNHGVKVDSLDGPTVVDTADNVDDEKVESIIESVLNTDDNHTDTDHNSVVAIEPTAVSGEHSADTEEGSKPSEEAESVVFKPEADPAQPTVRQAAQSREWGKDDPGLLEVNETNEKESVTADVLESKDNRDNLVTDWVTLHQTSKYFETFVESLDDMKELPSNASAGASDYGLLQSASPPQNMTRSEKNEENIEKNEKEREPLLKNSKNSPDNTKVELARSDLRSNPSEGLEEREPAEDEQKLKELTEVKTVASTSEADQSTEGSNRTDVKGENPLGKHKNDTGSSGGDRDKDASTKGNIEHCDSSKMETEDIRENNNVESVQPESTTEPDSELPTEKEEVKDEPEVEENQTTVEEIKDVPQPDHTADEALQAPGGPSEPKASQAEAQLDDTKETMERKEADNTEVTSVTDLIAVTNLTSSSTSDNGVDEGGQNKPQVQSKPLDRSGSLSSENKEVQLIEDFKPTVSKDQLSAYRVEETSLFGRSSYPQFTTQTGSGY